MFVRVVILLLLRTFSNFKRLSHDKLKLTKCWQTHLSTCECNSWQRRWQTFGEKRQVIFVTSSLPTQTVAVLFIHHWWIQRGGAGGSGPHPYQTWGYFVTRLKQKFLHKQDYSKEASVAFCLFSKSRHITQGIFWSFPPKFCTPLLAKQFCLTVVKRAFVFAFWTPPPIKNS